MSVHPILAIIPARGSSKGLPRKNLRPLAGLPLIAHSILFAKRCPQIDRCIVSTDSEEIAEVARRHGGDVPFLRPANLARDDTPMWSVVQHALREMELRAGQSFGSVLLLQPTAPCRHPEDVPSAIAILTEDPNVVGVVAVSEPEFNPRWVCVEEQNGYMRWAFPLGVTYFRRQDVPAVYRINGLLYLWRRAHVMTAATPQYEEKPHRMVVVPDLRAGDIDTERDLLIMELLIREGLVRLPWLDKTSSRLSAGE